MDLKTATMIFCWGHLAICLALIGILLCQARSSDRSARIGLLQIAAVLSAFVLALLVLATWSFHGQGRFDLESVKFRMRGPYGWIYIGSLIFPFLPATGLIPAMGKHPWINIGFAVAAMIGPMILLTIF